MTTTATHRRAYAHGTYLTITQPFGTFVAGAAQCADGKVRRLKRISRTADTFFSIPASIAIGDVTIAGYVTVETIKGYSTETADDPAIVRFIPYRNRKHAAALPDWPEGEARATVGAAPVGQVARRRFWLRMGSDYMTDAKPYRSRAAAIEAYARTARELDRYGQSIEASIHVTDARDTQPDEYPDWVLSIGPRGGIKVEQA